MPTKPLYPILFLRTNNLEETRNFYEYVLKSQLALDQNGCVIYLIGDYGYWGFCQTNEEILKPDQICLTIVVDSREQVDEWHKHLEESEVEVKRSPQYSSQYRIYNGFYVDPNGYTLEIQAFDKEGEPKGHNKFIH